MGIGVKSFFVYAPDEKVAVTEVDLEQDVEDEVVAGGNICRSGGGSEDIAMTLYRDLYDPVCSLESEELGRRAH